MEFRRGSKKKKKGETNFLGIEGELREREEEKERREEGGENPLKSLCGIIKNSKFFFVREKKKKRISF